MARILTSYFIVMCNRRDGQEAIVNPDLIRRDIVELIKNDRDYDWRKIAYIHHCDFGTLKDVTDELIEEARENEAPIVPHRQTVMHDWQQDFRKNGERV